MLKLLVVLQASEAAAPISEAADDKLIFKAEAGKVEKHKLPKQKLGCKLVKLSKLSF